jgi:putative transposase
MTIRHTSHARYDLWYHLAWSTKYRKAIFANPETRTEVAALLRAVAGAYDMEVGECEVLPDHVHLSLSAPPRLAPARAAQILKSVSTKLLFQRYPWLRQHYWGGEIWVAGYFVRSVGPGLTKEDIERYITEQAAES